MFTMQHDKWKVFIPAVSTMVVLHLSSVVLGAIFPLLFSQRFIINFSVILFLLFGILMLYDGYTLEEKNTQEKINDLEEELSKKNENPELKQSLLQSKEEKEMINTPNEILIKSNSSSPIKVEGPNETINTNSGFFENMIKNPYLHLIVLLFVGECGDRTQIAAIVLTATHNVWGIAIGGSLVFLLNPCRH